MSSTSIKNRDHLFVYFGLLILLLTSFPLAQGWIPWGDFRPRTLFIGVALLFYTKRFFSKDLICLYVYFLYNIVSFGVYGAQLNVISLFSRLMEFLIPIIIVPSAFIGNSNSTSIVAKYAIIITLLTITLTLRYVAVEPEIIRKMVTVSAWEGIEEVRRFWRLGVCSYSFALIMMCVPPILLQRFFCSYKKIPKFLCLLFAFYILYFVYVSQVTTTFFLCILMLVLVITTRRMSIRGSFIWVVLLTVFGLFALSFILRFFMDVLGIETEIGAHVSGIYQFIFEGHVSSDAYAVDGRVDLYDSSLDVFMRYPLFGNPIEKNGGHNFLLDNLAQFGIIGTLPLLLFFYYRFKMTLEYLTKEDKKIYAICILGFVLLTCIKNIVGIDHWAYLFLYIPCFLHLTDKKRNHENSISNFISR